MTHQGPREKRVLVAGATGYLGGYVAQEFKSRGYFVRALARSPGKLDCIRNALDDIVQAEVTRPETLEGVCDGIDYVFSSVGITRQRDKLSFQDVDYQGNKNLLTVAQRAGVEKFIYVSIFGGPRLLHLEIVKAHEDFVAELRASGMDHVVIRPTGFFSDMGEYLEMARKGRVYLIGAGQNRINPIHGADLAVSCVDAVDGTAEEVEVGGPEVLSHREIAALALRSIGKPLRISSLPVWVMRSLTWLTRLFDKHRGELLAFFTTAMTSDGVAPAVGKHRLEEHFAGLASAGGDKGSNHAQTRAE
jgi:uncharacterized protein YbjT (DUF2867 family)